MSESKSNQSVELKFDNWYLWDRHIKSTIRRKNAYIAFDPEPVDPHTIQQAVPQTTDTTGASSSTTGTTPNVSTPSTPTAEALKKYNDMLEKWTTANNIAAGVILGSISDEISHVISPEDSAKDMYDKLKARVIKQASGSSAFGTTTEIIHKQFKDAPTMDNFEQHLTFYRSKNAILNAVGSGIEDSFLAYLLLQSFSSNNDPIWSMASTTIVTTGTPIKQWSFEDIADRLREALRNHTSHSEKPSTSTNQAALNATADKANSNRYDGPPCTHPRCYRPKTHATENCWTKEKEERAKKNKKKHKAKKAKKKQVESSSELETSSDSGSDSDESLPRRRRHAHRSQTNSKKRQIVLNATSHHIRSYHGKATTQDLFIAHPDSGASNHMTHKRELFDPDSFETLSKPIPISLGDDSEIFATGRGTLCLMFNVDGRKKEGSFKDVLFVPELKVTLLSVGQSARLPHCKVTFDDNVCEYIDKGTNEVMARAFACEDTDLYTLDASPVTQKVAANLTSSPSRLIDINILHRRLGHLGIDNCRLMVNHRLVDGIEKVVGKEEFCEGCAYGRSKRKSHPLTGTTTKRRLERVHIDLCGPIPNSLGGNRYFLLIIDEHTHYHWVEILPKKSDALARLQKWKLEAERETDLKLRYLKSDRGKEFDSREFKEWLESEGITHEMSAPYEHEQNGLAERGIRNVSQRAMCQLFGANMSQGFWPYAVKNAVYLINRSPTTTLKNKTPFEAWTGKRPNIKHLRTFGETGYVHIPPETRKKWTKKARPCRLLGHTSRSTNYELWDPERHTIIISPNVDFDESSTSRHAADPKQNLENLSEAFGAGEETNRETPTPEVVVGVRHTSGDVSESESDEEALRPTTTNDESVPNGPDPVVPPVPIGLDVPPRRQRRSEIERLADAAGPPPTHEKRRPRAAISINTDSNKVRDISDHHASVGVMEVEKKIAENARKYAYCEALLAAENTNLHNEPVDVKEARKRPDWNKWEAAMQEELNSLERHGTYKQVKELPPGRKAVGYKWVFKLKLNPDNSIARYKARLVAKGYSQIPGQDFTETTSPVARLASYRALLSLAAKMNLEAHHLDIETAFLNGTLEEEIYMKAPNASLTGGNEVWQLRKSLYGLKQASHVWNKLLDSTLKGLGFDRCSKDTCVYLYRSNQAFIILAVHVDDMLIVSNSKSRLTKMKDALGQHFKVKDLGEVKYLLGIEVTRNKKSNTIELSQQAYIDQLLKRYNMQGAKPATTPLSSGVRLTQDDCPMTDEEKSDIANVPYASLVGALMYAAIGTRPDIAFAVGALSRFLSNPGRHHWNEAKRVLSYLKGTSHYAIRYLSDGSPLGKATGYSRGVAMKPIEGPIEGFCDSDWAGCVDTRRSTSGFVWIMNGGAICWRSRLQSIVALSSTEAEYVGATPAVQEIIWLRDLLYELGVADSSPSLLNMDNRGAVSLTRGAGDSNRTKHIDIRYHFIRSHVEDKRIKVQYTPTDEMIADILTKNLGRGKHDYFVTKLGMVSRLSGSVRS